MGPPLLLIPVKLMTLLSQTKQKPVTLPLIPILPFFVVLHIFPVSFYQVVLVMLFNLSAVATEGNLVLLPWARICETLTVEKSACGDYVRCSRETREFLAVIVAVLRQGMPN